MGKILAFSHVDIPIRLDMDDHYQNYTGVTEDINKAIKATARTITKSKSKKLVKNRRIHTNFMMFYEIG